MVKNGDEYHAGLMVNLDTESRESLSGERLPETEVSGIAQTTFL